MRDRPLAIDDVLVVLGVEHGPLSQASGLSRQSLTTSQLYATTEVCEFDFAARGFDRNLILIALGLQASRRFFRRLPANRAQASRHAPCRGRIRRPCGR